MQANLQGGKKCEVFEKLFWKRCKETFNLKPRNLENQNWPSFISYSNENILVLYVFKRGQVAINQVFSVQSNNPTSELSPFIAVLFQSFVWTINNSDVRQVKARDKKKSLTQFSVETNGLYILSLQFTESNKAIQN